MESWCNGNTRASKPLDKSSIPLGFAVLFDVKGCFMDSVRTDEITAESIVNGLIRGKEDQVRYLKESIKDAQRWLDESSNALAVAEKELEILRTLG